MDANIKVLVGNMVKDPEWSPNNKGNNFATCELVTNDSVYNKEIGQRVSTPQLFTINCKNQAAEYLMRYGYKGKRAIVIGKTLHKREIRHGEENMRPYIECLNIDIPRGKLDDFERQIPDEMLDDFKEFLGMMFKGGLKHADIDLAIKLFNKKRG